jgi:hypothetical protein
MKDKALAMIEMLTSEGEPADLEFDVFVRKNITDKRLLELNRVLVSIYKYAHIARNPTCIGMHKDWVKELNETYDELKQNGVL